MSTHYSILFASIRKVTQEKLSLGLLLFDGERVYFKFSQKKLAALRTFLPKTEYRLVHQSINAVKAGLLAHSQIETHGLGEYYVIGHSAFSLDYINYLSRYKNNLIAYSEPRPIDIDITPENVLALYANFIDSESEPAHVTKLTPVEQLSLHFKGRVEDHFSINYTLTSERIPKLVVPVKVDLLGKNGIDILVRTIDMSSMPEKITNEVATFFLLKDAYRKSKLPFKDFIVASEPSHKQKKQYGIWRQIKSSKDFTYLDFAEADRLWDYAEKNHIKPVNPEGTDDDPFSPF